MTATAHVRPPRSVPSLRPAGAEAAVELRPLAAR